jgi:hypothetical protein
MITQETFYDFALSYYIGSSSIRIQSEFESDLMKFIHLKKMLNKDTVNVRSVLNYIITLFNVFHHDGCVPLLFYKIDPEKWSELKTYLAFLNFLPERIDEIEVNLDTIPLHQATVIQLRAL